MQTTLFKKAHWNELKKGDVVFDLNNHDDVQCVLAITPKRRLIKLEDLAQDKVRWTAKLRYESKNYYYLDK